MFLGFEKEQNFAFSCHAMKVIFGKSTNQFYLGLKTTNVIFGTFFYFRIRFRSQLRRGLLESHPPKLQIFIGDVLFFFPRQIIRILGNKMTSTTNNLVHASEIHRKNSFLLWMWRRKRFIFDSFSPSNQPFRLNDLPQVGTPCRCRPATLLLENQVPCRIWSILRMVKWLFPMGLRWITCVWKIPTP